MTFLACFGIVTAFIILLGSVLMDDKCRFKKPLPWHLLSFKRKNPEV